MLRIHTDNKSIKQFCQKWKIVELSIFGSAIRTDFKPESDVDVLVAFEDKAGWSLFEILEMQEELKTILGRDVDLVEKRALKNPFRRHEILNHREIIYAD